MNESIKRVFYGKQKQADNQAVAVVTFMEDYLTILLGIKKDELGSVDAVEKAIKKAFDKTMDAPSSSWLKSDKLFLKLLVGTAGYEKLRVNTRCALSMQPIGENGKRQFIIIPSVKEIIETGAKDFNVNKERLIKAEKAETAEGVAEDLVKQIVCAIPNRSVYPEDDVSAALLYSQEYWKEH